MSLPTAAYMNQNGNIVRKEDCHVFAFSNAMKYGVSVFEGIRGYFNATNNQLLLFRVEEHLQRLLLNCRIMKIDVDFSYDDLFQELINTLNANEVHETVHIRILVYLGDDEAIGSRRGAEFVIGFVPMPSKLDMPCELKVGISTIMRLADNAMPPRVKCAANYVNNRAAEIEAAERGFDGPVMLTSQGYVSEGTGSCIFMKKSGKLITPSVTSDILESITRDTLITIIQSRLGQKVDERFVGRTELYGAEELFWCGSAHEIEPIVSVDGIAIGSGDAGDTTKLLVSAYRKAVQGLDYQSENWITQLNLK